MMENVNGKKKVEQWMDQLIHHYQDESYDDDDDDTIMNHDGMDFASNHGVVAQHILTQLESMNNDCCYHDLLQCYEMKFHPFFHQPLLKEVPMAVLTAYEYIICHYKSALKETNMMTLQKYDLDGKIENQFVQLISFDIQQYYTLTAAMTEEKQSKKRNPIPILLRLLGHVYDRCNNEKRRKYFLEEHMIWIFLFFCSPSSSSSSPPSLPNLSLEQWLESQSSIQHPLPKFAPSTIKYSLHANNDGRHQNFKILQMNRQSAEFLLRNQIVPTITSTTINNNTSLEDVMNILLKYVTLKNNPGSVYLRLRHHFFQHTSKQQQQQHKMTDLSSSPVSDSYVLLSSIQMLSYLSSTNIQICWEHVIPIYYTILDYQYECRPSYLRDWACHLFYQQLLRDTSQLQNIQLENTHLLLRKIFPTTTLPTISEEDDVHRYDDSHLYAHFLCQLWSQIVIHSSNNQWKQEAFQQMCLVIQKCFMHKQRRKMIIRSILIGGISPLLYNMMEDQIMELGRVGLQTLLPLLVSPNDSDDDFVNVMVSCVCLNHLLVCASDTMEHHGNKIMTCLLHNIYIHQTKSFHSLFRHTAAMALIICGTRAKQLCHTILATTTATDEVSFSSEKLQCLQNIVKDVQIRAKQIQSQGEDSKVHQHPE